MLYLCLLLGSSGLRAQQLVPLFPSIADGPVNWLDFDNDGDQDFVTMLNRDYIASPVLFKNENGLFSEVIAALEFQDGEIKVWDYENDGDQDIVIYDRYQVKGKLYKNVNGSFTSQGFYSVFSGQMKWIDFDGDSDEDLVGSNIDGISFFENVDGILTPQARLRINGLQYWAIADFDNDGHADIAASVHENYNDVVHIYYYQNDQLYLKDVTTSFPTGLFNTFVYTFDYDQDGDYDIYFTSYADGISSHFMYKNNGASFSIDSDPFYNNSSPINADEDEYMEYASVGTHGEYFDRTTSGKFEKINSLVLEDIYYLYSVSYSDHARENSFIAAYGEIYPNVLGTRLYQVKNGNADRIYYNPLDRFQQSSHLQFVDYDNDGWNDLYISGHPYSGAQLLRNTGNSFQEVRRLPDETYGFGKWIDFDFDGKLDLITVRQKEIWQTSGFSEESKELTTTLILDNVDRDSQFSTIDFDNDKDTDILVSDYQEGLFVNENGTFNSIIRFNDTFRAPNQNGWGDFDHDGDLDLILFSQIAPYYSDRLVYFENTGLSYKKVEEAKFPSLYSAEPYVADFNLDGYLDLFYIGEINSKSTVGLYLNDQGIFKESSTASFADLKSDKWYNFHVQIVDFDVDGYPDIMVTCDTYNTRVPLTRLYRNNNGNFETVIGHGLPELYGANFHWDDMDNDGDPDLLFSGYHGYTVTQLFRNDVIDVTGPRTVSFDPISGGNLIDNRGYTLSVNYHENVDKGVGTLRIYSKTDDQLIAEVSVKDASVSVEGKVLTIAISEETFGNGKEIYILADEGIVIDQNNNKSNAISNKTSWMLKVVNNKMEQTISFMPLSDFFASDPPFIIHASASSGLDVTLDSSNPLVAEIKDKNVLYFHEAGEVSITASQNGNEFYDAASSLIRHFTVKLVTGIENLRTLGSIYPNPATTTLTLDLQEFSDPVEALFYNARGEKILTKILTNRIAVVKIDDFTPGLYIVILRQGTVSKSKTFVKL